MSELLRCIREHRLSGSNVQLRPCGRLRCLECHREGARLARRVERLVEVVERHRRVCLTCHGRAAGCPTLRQLLDRLRARQRAFEAWRALGRRSHVHLQGVAYAPAS